MHRSLFVLGIYCGLLFLSGGEIAHAKESEFESLGELKKKLLLNECVAENDSSKLVNKGAELLLLSEQILLRSSSLDAKDAAMLERLLQKAAACLRRSLWLSPNHHRANLLMGVTQLFRAHLSTSVGKTISRREKVYLSSAKKYLGKVYALRGGSNEVLYYIAEAAVLEGEYATARALLDRLLKEKGPYLGSACVLMAEIYALEGDRAKQLEYLKKAVYIGWPPTAFNYALSQLKFPTRSARSKRR